MNIIEITNENFLEKVEQAELPVLVDCWAEWCGYCRRLDPAIEQIATEYEMKIVVAKVNIDDFPSFAEKFGIETIPTLILFKKGEVASSLIGPDSKSTISQWLENNGVEK